MRATIFALLVGVFGSGCGLERPSTDASKQVVALGSGWQYRWGDSPRDVAGKAEWLGPGEQGWTEFAPPKRPPGREGAEYLWMRTRLPESLTPGTHAFVRYVDLAFEAYVGDERVYRHGTLEPQPESPNSRPWHMFALGDAPQGRHLTLRIWSNHGTIGPFGRVYLGTEPALLRALLRTGTSALVLASLCLALAACALALRVFNRRNIATRALAGLAGCCGVYAFTTSFSPLKQVFLDAPTFWFYANMATQFLMPAFYFGVYATMTTGSLQRTAQSLRWVFAAYTVVALAGSGLGLFPLVASAPPGNMLVAAGILFALVTAIYSAVHGRVEVGWFLAGLSCAAVAGVHDILVDERIVTIERQLAPYGVFAFAGLIGIYLARASGRLVRERAAMADELGRRNQDLVDARENIAMAASRIGEDSRLILNAASTHVERSTLQREANARTSTTVAQIAVASREVAQHAAALIEDAEHHEGLAREGQQAVDDSVKGMDRLARQVRTIAQRADSLAEHGKHIGEIVDTVREISDRSAILAVNASLEAARAGDAGQGFAVVAREIRTLAEQSRLSTRKVNELLLQVSNEIATVLREIDAGQSGAEHAGALARRAGEAISGLAAALEGSARAARQIAEGTDEQSKGLDEISAAVSDGVHAIEDALEETRRIEQEARNLSALSAQLHAATVL